MFVDHEVLTQVLGGDVVERYGLVTESFSDGFDAPALLAMAYLRADAAGITLPDAMTQLLDEWDVYQAS